MTISSTQVKVKVAATNTTAAMEELETVTSCSMSTTRSTSVTEVMGQDYAIGDVHARTVSFSISALADASDTALGTLRTAYEGRTKVFLLISPNFTTSYECLVSDFSESGSAGGNVEVSVKLVHTGTTPAAPSP